MCFRSEFLEIWKVIHFLETLGPTESEKNVYIFSKHPMAAILDFYNVDFFSEIRQYLSF